MMHSVQSLLTLFFVASLVIPAIMLQLGFTC